MAKKWMVASYETDWHPLGALVYFEDDEDNKDRLEDGGYPLQDGCVYEGTEYDREQFEDMMEDKNPADFCPAGMINPEKTFWVAAIGGG